LIRALEMIFSETGFFLKIRAWCGKYFKAKIKKQLTASIMMLIDNLTKA